MQLFKEKGKYTEALKEFEAILESHPKKDVAQKEIIEITLTEEEQQALKKSADSVQELKDLLKTLK